MPLSSIYQVRARQTWQSGGKPLENVFFFEHTAGTGLAADLATSFGTAHGAAINAMQVNIVRNYSIDVINLGNLGDFDSLPWLGGGALGGEALPPHSAVSYTMKVNTRAVRKGSKRISGIPESAQAAGVIIDSGYYDLVEALRLVLKQELVSADDTWLPIIVKRVKEPVVGTVPLQYTYRLPATDAELVTGEVVTVLTTHNIGHQVSREV